MMGSDMMPFLLCDGSEAMTWSPHLNIFASSVLRNILASQYASLSICFNVKNQKTNVINGKKLLISSLSFKFSLSHELRLNSQRSSDTNYLDLLTLKNINLTTYVRV